MRKRLFSHLLSLVLVGSLPAISSQPASAADPVPALTAEQKRAVEALIREYIVNHPEVLLESLKVHEAKQAEAERQEAQAAVATYRNDLERDPTSPVAGNPKGDVTVVEFFDYRCAYCKRMVPAVQELLKSDPGVRYVFKEYPILSPESAMAARAALAVGKLAPDKYLPFHMALMSAQGQLTEPRILDKAKELGLAPDQVKKTMDEPQINDTLRRNFELGQKLKVNGTPAFIIGGQMVPGAIDLDTLRDLVAAARAA